MTMISPWQKGHVPQPNGGRGQIVGLIAAAAWAFCVPAQTYSAVLMPTAWFIFVFWFILWRIVKSESAPGWREALLLGLLVGLTATAIATILFLIPLLVCAIAFKPSIPTRSRFRVVGCALVLLGVVIGTSVLDTQLFHCAGPRFLVCTQRHQFLDRK